MLRFETEVDEINVMDGEAKIGSIYKRFSTDSFVFCTIDVPIAIFPSDMREILAELDRLNRAGEWK